LLNKTTHTKQEPDKLFSEIPAYTLFLLEGYWNRKSKVKN